MKESNTRRVRNYEKLNAFLEDDSAETITLCLYNREIKKIPIDFPSLSVEKTELFKCDLWFCTIRKN